MVVGTDDSRSGDAVARIADVPCLYGIVGDHPAPLQKSCEQFAFQML